jgi:hypothetical protein
MAEVVRKAVSEYLQRKASETHSAVLDETFGAVPEWQDVDSREHVGICAQVGMTGEGGS